MKTFFLWVLLCWVPAAVYAYPSECPGCHGAFTARESADTLLETRAPKVFDSDCPLSCPNGRVCVLSFTMGPICTTDKGYPHNLRRPVYAEGGNSSALAQDLRRRSSPEKRNPFIFSEAMKILGGAILDQALGFAIGPVFDSIFGGGNDNAALIAAFHDISRQIIADVKKIVQQEISAAWQDRDEQRVIGILSQIDAIPDALVPTQSSDLSKFDSFDRHLRHLLYDNGLGSLDQTVIFLMGAQYTIHVAPFFLLAASAHIGLELELIRSAKLWAANGGPDHTAEYLTRIKRKAKTFADHMDTLELKAVDLLKADASQCHYSSGDYVYGNSITVRCSRWANVRHPDGSTVEYVDRYYHEESNRCTGFLGRCSDGDKSKTRNHCRDRSAARFCAPLLAEMNNHVYQFLWHGPHGLAMLSPEWKYIYRYFRHIQSNGDIDTFNTDCWTNNLNTANPSPSVQGG